MTHLRPEIHSDHVYARHQYLHLHYETASRKRVEKVRIALDRICCDVACDLWRA